ncbi:MAG: response regulator, partial [Gammaproteobacteria bacterium]|nr:response regulator [Gammaproteobacteria bacterium]
IAALLDIAPQLRILVVSALSDKATVIEALKRGAHGFLHKPFTDARLAGALLELMEEPGDDHGRHDRQ